MKKSYLLGAVCAFLVTLSFNSTASVVNADWKNPGDNLITYDGVSGLRWLDLTETNGMTRTDVLAELGAGGQFDGFRYATSAEVINLWSNYGINLSAGQPEDSIGALDPNIMDAALQLGNIVHEYSPSSFPYGTLGITAQPDPITTGKYARLGAYYNTEKNLYNTDESMYVDMDASAWGYTGHYLVSSVPIPAALWLFGSGLLGLIGIARRKKV